jgi:hypothetical protein
MYENLGALYWITDRVGDAKRMISLAILGVIKLYDRLNAWFHRLDTAKRNLLGGGVGSPPICIQW